MVYGVMACRILSGQTAHEILNIMFYACGRYSTAQEISFGTRYTLWNVEVVEFLIDFRWLINICSVVNFMQK